LLEKAAFMMQNGPLSRLTMEVPMVQATSLLTKEQWIERLQAWAVERWGEARAQAIREDIEATAEHLVSVSEYPLAMEQIPGFFIAES
jgi:predicted DNA-binding protein